jgi:hypothetical protein
LRSIVGTTETRPLQILAILPTEESSSKGRNTTMMLRELTADELENVGGGCLPNCGCPGCPNSGMTVEWNWDDCGFVGEGASLWSWVKVAALQTLADQGPVGAFLAAAANAYFD